MGYAWSDVQIYFAMLGESGRELYRLFIVADFGNAVLMAVGLTLLMAFLLDRLNLGSTWVGLAVYLPALGGSLDIFENVLLLSMLGQFPELGESTARAASAVTSAKLATGVVAVAAIAISLLGWAAVSMRSRE